MTIPLRVTSRLATFVAIVFSTGCAGYVPGENAYWDGKVDEFCKKDGGVRIFEKLRISSEERSSLSRVNGMIGIPIKELAHPKSPAYGVLTQTNLHEGNPQVVRSVAHYYRRSDGAILATSVVYARFGGDFPSHAYPSSHSCPDSLKNVTDLQQLFISDGKSK